MQYLDITLKLIKLIFLILSFIAVFFAGNTCLSNQNIKCSLCLRLYYYISILFLFFFIKIEIQE